ncbi:glutaredoxin [Auriscalpium vulgare]|uniref:Glutaredoxin n=1 Tax=Auriscalpium vulgare TaxID=40419 RepID=A0ACB8RRU8_9AGAM|nr:glutaredoxin [Auriscalpium vulgare]
MFRTAFRPSLTSLARTAPTAALQSTSAAVLRRLLSTETRSQIQKAVESSPLVLFMKGTPSLPECGFSRAVVQVLDLHGVPAEKMKTFNVLVDSELRSGIKEFSEWPTIPQLYVNSEFVGGCDIVLGMHQSGELEDLLVKNNIIEAELEPAVQAASA